jgi:hypothetical protein
VLWACNSTITPSSRCALVLPGLSLLVYPTTTTNAWSCEPLAARFLLVSGEPQCRSRCSPPSSSTSNFASPHDAHYKPRAMPCKEPSERKNKANVFRQLLHRRTACAEAASTGFPSPVYWRTRFAVRLSWNSPLRSSAKDTHNAASICAQSELPFSYIFLPSVFCTNPTVPESRSSQPQGRTLVAFTPCHSTHLSFCFPPINSSSPHASVCLTLQPCSARASISIP